MPSLAWNFTPHLHPYPHPHSLPAHSPALGSPVFWVPREEKPGSSSASADSLKRVAFLSEGVKGTDLSREKWVQAEAKADSSLETASPAVEVFLETEQESPALAWVSLLEEKVLPDASWVGTGRRVTRQKNLLRSPV